MKEFEILVLTLFEFDVILYDRLDPTYVLARYHLTILISQFRFYFGGCTINKPIILRARYERVNCSFECPSIVYGLLYSVTIQSYNF